MDRIESLYNEWRSLLPMKNEDQIRLDQKFMLEFNYNSNHMEGNTLTYGQTEFLLMFGKVVDNANMRDLEEMKASNVGLQMVKVEASAEERPLTEAFIRDLHRTLFREDYEETREYDDGTIRTYTVHVGRYKTRPNSVITKTGETFLYASPEETPALMTDLVRWYNDEEKKQQLSVIELATLFHYRYIRIHPFEDGNGRVSRLLVNFILHRKGYPMIVVKSADKDNYLFALNRCDMEVGRIPSDGAKARISQISPFVEYLSKCLERALIISLKAARGESIEEEDDFEKQMAIIERNARKAVPQDGHVVTPQNKIDVYNQFHRQFANRLMKLMEPVRQFFNTQYCFYFMTMTRDRIAGSGFFKLDTDKDLSLDIPVEDLDVLKEAQSIWLNISFSDVKTIYKLKNQSIRLNESVYFENTYYVFNNKTYSYGSFPTKMEIDNLLKSIKDDILQQMNMAID